MTRRRQGAPSLMLALMSSLALIINVSTTSFGAGLQRPRPVGAPTR